MTSEGPGGRETVCEPVGEAVNGEYRARKRLHTEARVRAVALALMRENGFDGVTVEQIAATANVSASTVYRYFGTKEAIVLDPGRLERAAQRIAKDTSQRSASEAFTRAVAKVHAADESVAVELALLADNPTLTPAWELSVLDCRRDVADAFATRRGAKSAGTKDLAAASASLGALMALLPRWHRNGAGRDELERLLTKAFNSL